MLHYNYYPSKKDTSQLLVMLHGFISDSSTFDAHVTQLTAEVHVVTVHLPGHGDDTSPMSEVWSFDMITQGLNDVLAQFQDKQLYLHGYSMGGRVALYYALHGEATLAGLILESASPGIADAADCETRVQVDQARARVLTLGGIALFVNDWEKLPLFMSQQRLPAATRQRIREMRLRQNPERLAKALTDYGTGAMPNLWPLLPSLKTRTCLIVGAYDEPFCRIATRMLDEIPNATMHTVEDAGHTVHVENEVKFDKIVLGFLIEEDNHGDENMGNN